LKSADRNLQRADFGETQPWPSFIVALSEGIGPSPFRKTK